MSFVLARVRAVVLLSLLAGCLAVPAPATAMPDAEYFGLNAQPMVKLGFVPPERWGPYLDAMAAGGIRVARVDAGWAFAEPSAPAAPGQHTYVWNRPDVPTQSLDLLARELAARGIRMLPVLATPPGWARGPGTRVAPERYDDFAAFAAAFAARYGSRGAFWAENPGLPVVPPRDYELWTEANSANMWTGRSDAAAYMEAAPRIAAAIRANDPGSRVLASVGWEGFDGFIRELYARGAKGVFDAIGFHPYAPHAPAIIDLTVRLRRVLSQVGDPGIPIEITETGQPIVTSGPGSSRAGSGGVSDAARAATQSFTADALARSDCGVGAFVVYTLVGSETRLEPIGEGFMGVVRVGDAQPNATGAALFAAAQRWRARPRTGIALCGAGPTAPSNLLPLAAAVQHTKPTCATASVTYEGNPIEGAFLVLRTADGRTSKFEVDAFGRGEVCIPDGPPIWSFDVRAEVDNVAASPTYRCPVADGPCVVVAQATDTPPSPPGAGCRWQLRGRVLSTKARSVRVRTALSCTPKAARVPFSVAVRPRGRSTAGRPLRRVTVSQGTMRTITLPRRLASGDRVVVTSTANPRTGVPGLTATARTLGGTTATGEEGCEWKVETRVVRRARARTQVRIRVACIPPGARTVRFTASVRRKGARRSVHVRNVTLSTGREQIVSVRARLRAGDRVELLHTGDTKRGTPRITARATVPRKR